MLSKSILIQLFFGFISHPAFSCQPHEFCCYEEFSVLRLLLQVPAHDKFWLCARGVLGTSAWHLGFFLFLLPDFMSPGEALEKVFP